MSEVKTLQEIDELIDLFLSSDFDPLPKSDSAINFKSFRFEADVDGSDSEEENTTHLDQDTFVGVGAGSKQFKHDDDKQFTALEKTFFASGKVRRPSLPPIETSNRLLLQLFVLKEENDYFKRKCGRALAKMGDELCTVASTGQISVTDELLRIFLPLEENTKNKESVNKSWDLFKNLLDKYIVTQDSDAPKYLGAVLLTVHGLSHLGSGAKELVKNFTRRYITQRGLDRDIARIGGLNGFMRSQLD